MKTRKRKIGIEIIRTAVVDVRRNLIIGLVALLTGIFALPASAQCEAKNDAFQSGEHVMYDLYFNWKFVWVKADACRPLLPADLPCAVSAGLFCGVPRYNHMLPDPWFALLLTQRLLPFSIFPKLSGGRTGCAGSLPIPDCLLQWVCG